MCVPIVGDHRRRISVILQEQNIMAILLQIAMCCAWVSRQDIIPKIIPFSKRRLQVLDLASGSVLYVCVCTQRFVDLIQVGSCAKIKSRVCVWGRTTKSLLRARSSPARTRRKSDMSQTWAINSAHARAARRPAAAHLIDWPKLWSAKCIKVTVRRWFMTFTFVYSCFC